MKNCIYSKLFILLLWFVLLFTATDTFIKSRYACQGDKLRIRCKSRRMIRIYSANYGRTEPGSSICPNVNTSDTTCKSSKALNIVFKKCTNRTRCNIKADASMFPDPCPDTFKYLDVIYGCVPRPPTMTTASPSTRKRRKTPPRHQATTTAEWITEHEPTTAVTTTQPTTTRKTISTEQNVTTTLLTNFSTPTTKNSTLTAELMSATVESTPTAIQSTTAPPLEKGKTGYIQRGQPKYVLILFLSGVAIATVLLLVLLLGLHLKARRTKKFVMQQAKPTKPNNEVDDEIEDDADDDDDDSDDDSDDEDKNVTIEIQAGDKETKQISVKPGDIIIIDSKDVENDDSEDLGYMSEIVRYYNSRNMAQDDGKQSLTCETPSVNSIPNSEAGDKREPQYDTHMPKANGICIS